jgi:hypothetical protein
VSESLRPGGRIDWSLVVTLVVLFGGGITSFVVLREAVANLRENVGDLRAKDREHSEAISEIREDRRIEKQINDLTTEVKLLRQEVGQLSKEKKR